MPLLSNFPKPVRQPTVTPAVLQLAASTLSSLLATSPVAGEVPVTSPTLPHTLLTDTVPVLLEAVAPLYPLSARERGQEGWVELSFIVSADGRVLDPIVERSSGQAVFERAALDAATRLLYSPATVAGKPVEQVETKVVYKFGFSEPQLGARPEFARRYRQLQSLVDAGDFSRIEDLLQQIESKGTWNLYEASRLHLVRYQLCRHTNDRTCMLHSLSQAASLEGSYLERPVYRNVLRSMAELQVGERLYAEALTTIETLNGLRPPLPSDDPLIKAAADIRAAISGGNDLIFTGQIAHQSESGVAHHTGVTDCCAGSLP